MSGVEVYAWVVSWSSQSLVDIRDWSLVTSNIRIKPMASLKKAVVRLLNLSCPAVSHSCSWTL